MDNTIRILIVGDNISDYELAQFEIRNVMQGSTFKQVEKESDFIQALQEFQPQVILSDYKLPSFDGIKVLELAQQHLPFAPVIIWTGAVSEEMAVECMKMGASDYILKDNIKRLGRAVIQALKEREILLERKQAEEKYQAIFENSPIGIFQSTPQGQFLRVNPAMARIYGYASPEEMIRSITDIHHQIYMTPEDRHEFTTLLETEQIVQNFERANIRKDGSIFWTSTSARTVCDEAGNVLYYEGFLQDITARKGADRKITDSEKRFRSLIENGMDNISLLANDGTLLWENPSIHQTLGYQAGQFLGQNIFRLMHPDDLERTSDLFARLVQEPGQVEHATFRLKHFDGSWRWVEATATNMLDEASVHAVVINYRDVTERVEAETRINDLLSFNEGMLNYSSLGIFTYKVTGECVFANQNAATIVGTTVENLMLQNFHTIEAWKKSGLYTLVENAMATKSATRGDVHHISTFGKDVWLAVHCVTFTSKDEEHVLLSISDITERKQAEQDLRESQAKYKNLVETSHDLIWAVDAEGRITFLNRAAKDIYGFEPEELLGHSFFELMDPEHYHSTPESFGGALTGMDERQAREVYVRHRDGRQIILSAKSIILRDENGNVTGVTGSSRDITEQKRAEQTIHESEKRLHLALVGAHMGVWEWDLQANSIYWSPECFEIIGMEDDGLARTIESFMDLVHPEDVKTVMARAEEAIANRTLYAAEFRTLRQDGETRWISNHGRAEYDSSGKAVRLIGIVQDISQTKQAETERQAVLDIMQGLAHTKDLQEFLKLVHLSLGNVIYAENFFVVLYHQESKLFEEIYSVDQYDPPAPPSRLEKSITSYVFRSGEPLLLTHESFDKLIEQGEIELVGTDSASWLGAPLKTTNGTIGVLAVQDYHDPNRYSERDKSFLASVASQVALAIERKQAETELQQKNDDLGLLNAINEAVVRGQDLDSIVKLLSDELNRIFLTVGSTIYMLSSDKRSITMQQYSFSAEIAARIEKLLGFKIPQIHIPIKEGGHFHKALISKQSAITTDPQEIQDWVVEFSETKFLPAIAKVAVRRLIPHIYRLLNIKSTIIIPLLSQDEVIGFLDVSSSNILTTRELQRISAISEQLSSLLQRQQANERIRRSEEFLQGIQNSLSAHIAILDEKGDIVQVNSAWREFGKRNGLQSKDFCLGMNYFKVCEAATGSDAKVARQVAAAIQTVLAGEKQEASVEYACHGPQEKRWFTVHITCFDDGEQKWVILAHENITERKQAEAAEREQRVLAEALRDTSQILSSSLDYGDVLDHILTAVERVVPHDAATIMLIDGDVARVVRSKGYQSRDPQTNVMEVWLPLSETTNLRQMLETKQPEVVYDIHSYPGWKRLMTTDWLRSNVGAPILVHEEVIGFILLDSQIPGYFTPVHAERLEAFANQAALAIHNANLLKQAQAEIIERKRAEESLIAERKKLQDYLDIAGVMMLALDRHGRVALINQKGCEILGCSAEEVIGKNWIETFVPAETRAELLRVFETLSVGDTTSTSYHENPVLTKNGEQRVIAWHNTLLRDAQGTVISTLSSGEDITERKQMEAKLQASESRYRLATQATKDVIWEWNAETNRLLWNENAQSVFGYSPEEVGPDATWWDEHIHPEDRERVQSKLSALTGSEGDDSVWLDEYRFLLKDDSYAYINDHAYIERDTSGKAIRMIGAMSNITERKRAEQALRESEALYRRAIEVAGAVPYYQSYYDHGRSIKYDFIGEGIRQITGYGPEEFNSKLWDSLVEEVNLVEDLAGYSLEEGIQRVRSGENPVWKCEHRIRARDGKTHWVFEAAVELRDEHGVARGSIGTFQDITTRKQAEAELRASEERFRQLATNIEEAFWMTDAQTGQELYVSPAAAAIWGNSVENLMQKPESFINIVVAEDREFVLATLERQRNGEKTEIEYRVQRSDGSIRWVWDRAFPIFDERGKVKTLAGIAADITERKQAEIDLIQSQARYQDLFDSSPISLWEEDYSLVKQRIEILQQEGITDLEEYFSSHPDVILELASSVKVIGVNRASMELYNVKQKDELLRSLPEFVSDETLLHFQQEVLGLMSRAKFEWEGLDLTLDGRKLIVMVNGSIPPGHEADWSKVIVSITDVTERKLAEERLRASEERYHSLFQHLVDGFALHEIITDDQGKPIDYRFLEINPAFEKLTGLRAEVTVGRRVNEILPRVGNERFISVYGKVALTGESVHFEEYSAPLGKYYDINAYSPRHGQFAVTFEDITERKQTEANLRKLSRAVEQSASTIVITDIQGRIEYVNPKFTEVTGYSFEEAIGQNPRILKTGHTPAQEYKRLWETIATGEEWRGELFNRKKNGDLFWEQATISPIQNEQGEITHFIAVKEDITQRKQSEAEIQRHLAELQAVYENGLAVGKLLEPEQIGERLIETFARHLSWHHVTIRLLRPGTDELELIAFNLPNINQIDKIEVENHFSRLINRVGQGLSGWVVQTGISVRSGQVHSLPQYVSTQVGIESGLYMPLKIGDRIIGVISVESEEPEAFTEQDERLLATLATQAAIAFENARLYQAAQQEIAERERAQAALRTSETHYRELADSITEIMFELDQDLHYTHWNRASEIFSGIAAEDAIGQSMLDLFGDSQEQSAREKIYRSVLSEQQAQTFETEVFPQGQRRILEINAYPSARGVSVVARDITERRLSEALQQRRIALMEFSAQHDLEDLMQRAIDEVSELTDSHIGFLHFVEADQKVIHMQAWSSETVRTVGTIEEKGMHYPVESAGVWADAVRQKRPIIHNDYESLPDKKGLPESHARVIRELVVPIIRDDRIAGVLGIGNRPRPYDEHDVEITERFADYAWDIIERKQMESALSDERNQLAKRVEERTADLSRANSNLARALRVKDEFLANMSHELRTPLNAILGLSESLSEQVAGPLNEKQQKYLNTINESGHHLLSLINDILDLAKIEAGQISLDINKVDVNSVCQASLRMIKQLAQKKNQEVLFEIDNGLGLMWADERRLKQMIVNLLSNAVKFTPENGRLGLEVHGDQAGNRILITVWDRGIGISNQDLDRLFRPFVQLDSGLAREATGTGLGLALVAQMARLHGGSVNVDSHVGEGSRFTIQLPWEPALAADVNSRLRTTGKFRAIDIHARNKPTILLVEDTREVVMMLADYLEMAGFTIATAQDGIDGLEQAKLTRPDLILMDIQMPRMDGFETTQKLRMIPEFKETPIIALTALAMPNDRQRCLDAGMSEYISKPVNLKMLLKLIRGILYEKEGDPT